MLFKTPNEFELELFGKNNKNIFSKIEDLDKKNNNLEMQILEIKKKIFPSLFEYELKRNITPTLLPSSKVQQQMKLLMMDQIYLKYIKQIKTNKKLIENYNTRMEDNRLFLNSVFLFQTKNTSIHKKLFVEYHNNPTNKNFNNLLISIFASEYRMPDNFYWTIKFNRQYEFYNQILIKSPSDLKWFYKEIFRIQQVKDIIYDYTVDYSDFDDYLNMVEYNYNYNKEKVV